MAVYGSGEPTATRHSPPHRNLPIAIAFGLIVLIVGVSVGYLLSGGGGGTPTPSYSPRPVVPAQVVPPPPSTVDAMSTAVANATAQANATANATANSTTVIRIESTNAPTAPVTGPYAPTNMPVPSGGPIASPSPPAGPTCVLNLLGLCVGKRR